VTCPGCGGRLLYEGRAETRATVAGVPFRCTLPATICRDCEREALDRDAVTAFDYAAALALFRRGARSGEAVRHARRVLGWQGRELAEALGVAPETVSRWEHGHLDVPPHAFALVGCLLEDRDRTYRLLAALHEPCATHTNSAPVDLGDLPARA